VSELPRWGAVEHCPKCTGPRQSRAEVTMQGGPAMIRVEHKGHGTQGLREHMKITCWRCGYSWQEQPADAAESTDPDN
jgi:predicted nucleic-acid-binding Zn-ribbon protein